MNATQNYSNSMVDSSKMNSDEIKADLNSLPTAPPQAIPPYLYPIQIPPPYIISSPALQGSVQGQSPVVAAHMQWPPQHVILTGNRAAIEAPHIPDYIVWSIMNTLLFWPLGLCALFLSFQTRRMKRNGNIEVADAKSKAARIVNIFTTIIFFVIAAFSVIYFVYKISILEEMD